MARTTELQAINKILRTINSQTLTSLVGVLPEDAAQARQTLDEVRRAVLDEGWFFNSEKQKTLVRQNDKRVKVDPSYLRVDVSDGFNPEVNVFQRGDWMYDAKNHTYFFESDLTCDIVVDLEWSELPEAARRYIMIRAARVLADGLERDQVSHGFNERDEVYARAMLEKHNTNTGDFNVLKGPAAGRVIARQSVLPEIR